MKSESTPMWATVMRVVTPGPCSLRNEGHDFGARNKALESPWMQTLPIYRSQRLCLAVIAGGVKGSDRSTRRGAKTLHPTRVHKSKLLTDVGRDSFC